MLLNYFKIALRSLLKSKIHSFINISGLTLGVSCCLLIALFVHEEWTFDTFHSKSDRIYRAYVKENWGENQEFFSTVTPFPLGPALKESFEEVEDVLRITEFNAQLKVNDQNYNQNITVMGQSLLNMFDFDLQSGDRRSALTSLNHVVLTERTAERYFGKLDPMGKTISIQMGEGFDDFVVKGVLATPPTNSSLQFEIIISDLNFSRLYSEGSLNSGWFNITPETYVLLREGTDVHQLESKFPAMLRSRLGDKRFTESNYQAGLQPLTTIHLDTSFPAGMAPVSNPRYAYILSAVAVLLLSIACINFITLSVGRSLQRAKEVGIRKVAGAIRSQLIVQFIGEAVIITLISLLLGLIVAQTALPLFNELSGKSLTLKFDFFVLLTAFSLLVMIGMIAGSYPAFVLSSFRPVTILKGGLKGIGNKQGIRKVLVGIQLVLSIFLISSTLIMRNQLTYLQQKNLGYEKEQLVAIPINVTRTGSLGERIQSGFDKAEQLKTALSQIPGISGICASSHDFGTGQWAQIGYTDENQIYRTFFMNVIDPEYIRVLNIEIASGRNFNEGNPSDVRMGVIINEAFARSLNWDYPFDKKIPGKDFPEHQIIGVVKDFHFSSLYTSIAPLAMVMTPNILLKGSENFNMDSSPYPKLMVRILPGEIPKTIEQIKTAWEKTTANEEFIFRFVDETLNQQYRSDQNLGKIIRYATIIAIMIGSMGLYGLASLAMQNRRKEISIRKVLGATQGNLLILLSRDYVILVLSALVISVPATWYLMQDWLATFEYRIDVTPNEFLLAGGISLTTALFTIAYQIVRTAFEKPAETLKYE